MTPIWSGVYERIGNGNLGILPTSPVGTILAVGPCSEGTANEIYYYGKSDAGAIRDELGYGDLVERLLDFFALCGQKSKAIVVPAEPDVAGATGPAEKDGDGTATATAGGTPRMTAQAVVEILTGGDFGDATFRVSLDGGDNWSGAIAIPETPTEAVDLGAGITVAFDDVYPSDDSFVEGDTWSWYTSGPSCSLVSLLAALNVAKEAELPFEWAVVMTFTGPATWTGLGVWADSLFSERHRPIRVLTEAAYPDGTPAEYVTNRVADMNGFAHDRVAVCAAPVEAIDLDGYQFARGLSGLVAGLIAAAPVQASIGETKYYQLTPVVRLAIDLTPAQLETLNEARYIVPRRYVGLSGWYINDGNMAADATSDYQTVEVCRMLDNVIRNLRVTALGFVHSQVLVRDGVADPAGLKALEGACKGTLKGLKETFSEARFEIPEEQDVLATRSISANCKVWPVGIAKEINLNFALARF